MNAILWDIYHGVELLSHSIDILSVLIDTVKEASEVIITFHIPLAH